MSDLRIDRVVTTGTFTLDGETHEVSNNVWILGDDDTVVVIDAAHDAQPIVDAVAGREVTAVLCTHAHDDHITVAPDLGEMLYAPVMLHPGDDVLWKQTHSDAKYWSMLDGQRIGVANSFVTVIHTPGHSPGSVCLHAPECNALFSGDTLFYGGPGATGRTFSDFPTIIDSIRGRLLTLPGETVVRTGHGELTSISEEAPHLREWIARGH